MMINAIIAETLKFRRHRATWLMLWIFPVGLLFLTMAALVHDLIFSAARSGPALTGALWIERSANVWAIPQSAFGRIIIGGFCAMVFAGEYGWNTWKLIIPARARSELIVAKWLVAAAFSIGAFALADLIALLGQVLSAASGGAPIPTDVTAFEVVRRHMTGLVTTTLIIAYTVVTAGLIGVTTRSVLATAVSSVALTTLEQFLPVIAPLLNSYSRDLSILTLQVLPFYHIENVLNWARSGQVLQLPLGSHDFLSAQTAVSVATVGAWVVGLGAVTDYVFKRQDQN